MELKRVVVTGLGAITPLGNDVETVWNNAINGVSGAGPITHFDASLFKTQFACEVKNFDPADHVLNKDDRREAKDFKRMDLYAQYAMASSKQAIEDSKILESGKTDRNNIGNISDLFETFFNCSSLTSMDLTVFSAEKLSIFKFEAL